MTFDATDHDTTCARRALRWRRTLIAGAMATLLTAQLGATLLAADGQPWSETFSMPLSGSERMFAVYAGGTYLIVEPGDSVKPDVLLGRKDVVLVAKLERDSVATDRQRLRMSAFPKVLADGDARLFSTRLEGDNLYLFGTLSIAADGSGRFEVTAIEPAPSDAQIIAGRLAGIDSTDYPARLKAAADIRERAAREPNKEFWLAASDNLVAQTITEAAEQAGKAKDYVLLNQAIGWSVDVLRDPARAGEIASVGWVRSGSGPAAEDVTKRLRRLGLEWHKDRWRPRAEALSMEFEDRYAVIGWKDADAFYRLGRWSDVNGEFLPRAKDRSYRCYQSGYRADPNHQGIRNELGLPNSIRGDGTQAQISADFQHAESGTLVPAPQGWKRGERIEGDITWIDPASETAYIAASVMQTPVNPDLTDLWASVLSQVQLRTGFTVLEEDEPTFPQGLARRLVFQFREGSYQRQHAVILALNPTAQVAVRLDAGFSDEEAADVKTMLNATFDRLVIPNQAPTFTPPVPTRGQPPGQGPSTTPPVGGPPVGGPPGFRPPQTGFQPQQPAR